MATVEEIAYRLWQVRTKNNIPTNSEKDWLDAERIYYEKKGYEELRRELRESGKKILSA